MDPICTFFILFEIMQELEIVTYRVASDIKIQSIVLRPNLETGRQEKEFSRGKSLKMP